MAICDRGGLPIAVHVASASPYEPHLVPATLDARFLPDLPWCLIGDRGYDSDGLDDLLMTQYGIEMIAANRRGRATTHDGRPLRRAKRRWKIERLSFANIPVRSNHDATCLGRNDMSAVRRRSPPDCSSRRDSALPMVEHAGRLNTHRPRKRHSSPHTNVRPRTPPGCS
jgi:hypothetical protein